MNIIKELLKGILIGVANIIPGVSGGTMAVSMGIYDKMISAVSNLFTDFKKSMRILIPIFLGAGLGIAVLSFVIEYFFKNYPIQTNFLFIGLIVGGLPMIIKKVKGVKIKASGYIAFLAFLIIVVVFPIIGGKEGAQVVLSVDPVSMAKLFAIGIVASATMVIPGVSGSMMLMLLGYYTPIIEQISGFIKALAAFDVPALLNGLGILIPFGIGVVLGIFAIAKLIEIILKKAPTVAYCAIIGLIVGSPVAILYMSDLSSISIVSVLVGIVTFVIGCMIALKLGNDTSKGV